MPLTAEQLVGYITDTVEPGFRHDLVSRGLARSMLWSDGELPAGSPVYSSTLGEDLVGYGFALFSLCLQLRDTDRANPILPSAFERAAEAIESVIRRGPGDLPQRGFLTVVAAASYHLGHFSARAFSLFSGGVRDWNFSPSEQSLTALFIRDLNLLRDRIAPWFIDGGFDTTLTRLYQGRRAQLSPDQALQFLLNSQFHKSLASFEYALETGSDTARTAAIAHLDQGIAAAHDFEHITFWWIFTITRHLFDDLWDNSLHVRLPNPPPTGPNDHWASLRKFFVATLARRSLAEIDLWPSQLEAAARAFDTKDDLIVSLPTSAGKTRVAELCILRALSLNRRVVFVTPLRALSAQTERTLRRTFVPLGFSVSSLYGASGITGDDLDSLSNRDIVVTTPEKLDFALRNDPSLLDSVGLIVLDEGHSIGIEEREIRYEILVQRLLRRRDADERRIVCLSALLPAGDELNDFVAWLRNDAPGSAITCDWRPTRRRFGELVWQTDRARLAFRVNAERPFVPAFLLRQPPLGRREKPFPQNSQEFTLAAAWRFADQGQTVLVYCPQKRSVESLASQALKLSRQGYLASLLLHDEAVLRDAISIGTEWLGSNHPAVQCLHLGVAVHHGSLPRPFQRAVEKLLREGVLRITIASPTLAQGLNLSATTLLFHSLYRVKKPIPTEEFLNVAGRAGRAHVDVEGQIVCLDFANRLSFQWDQLVRAAGRRSVMSGLLRLVFALLARLRASTNYPLEQLIEYVTGSVAAWDPPQPTQAEPRLPQLWEDELGRLDAALLSLIPHETAAEDVPRVLDEVLASSLWQRSLQRGGAEIQRYAQTILRSRAVFIWERSEPLQRKAAFYAGVNFNTSMQLAQNAAALNEALSTADAAFEAEEMDKAIDHILRFARIAFTIPPFAPSQLPNDWEQVAKEWIRGKSLADLGGGVESEIVEFLEGTMVYRLVWAMEAVRVRAVATGEADEDRFNGRAATAVETGTPQYSASLLIHCGLGSRVAAIKSVEELAGDFRDTRGMRQWIRSDLVARRTNDPQWPTPETAGVWREFVQSLERAVDAPWEETRFSVKLEWDAAPLAPGTPVRIREGARVHTIAWDPVGVLSEHLEFNNDGVLNAHVGGDSASIEGEFLGRRRRRQPDSLR
jgi:superfamily II DNA/RNA helicase